MEPLPPVKEVEYRCYISKIFEELSGSEYMTFAFETAKEFSSFRYEIAVRYRIQPGLLEFKVLGMTATRTMMPAFGTARSVLKVPLLPFGVYAVKMIKSDGIENIFSIEVTKRGFQILQPIPRKRFIDLIIESKAAAPGARHTSTVSKAPPTPLVPRTIQKRQVTEITPEEQAILDSLKPETPEEREAREEREAFGTSTPRSSAKRAIQEIEEIPMDEKHRERETAKHSKDAPKVAKSAPKSANHKPVKAEKKPAAKSKPTPKHTPAKKAPAKKAIAKPKPKSKASAKRGNRK